MMTILICSGVEIMTHPPYVKKINNYNFIANIVAVKCIRCGEFFEPDKTKPIDPVCGGCVWIPEVIEMPEENKKRSYTRSEPRKYQRYERSKTPEEKRLRKKLYMQEYRKRPNNIEYQRNYMREYMRKYNKLNRTEKP